MLSRVADSLYWLARYMERADNVSRFIGVNLHLTLDLSSDGNQQWSPLIAVTGDFSFFINKYQNVNQTNAIEFLVCDEHNPNSIRSCIAKARENARAVRDILSTEIWEQINHLYLMTISPAAQTEVTHNVFQYCKRLSLDLQLLNGLIDNTMSRNEAWHFLRLGRCLERAEKTARLLDVKYYILLPTIEHVGSPIDHIQWAAVLTSTSAVDMYRQTYRRFSPTLVTKFLLLNREFPRAVIYCLIDAENSLHKISSTPLGQFSNSAERQIGRVRSHLEYIDINDIIKNGLHEFINGLIHDFNGITEAVQSTFFSINTVHVKAHEGVIS